jgi:competence protein ComEC
MRPRLLSPGLTGVLACLCALLVALPAQAGQLLIDIIDVGQGDAILLRSPEGKSVLIDTGTGRTDMVAELQGRGVQQIDLAVSTHPHADHIGGMEAVLRAIPVGVYMDNGVPHTSKLYTDLMAAVEELSLPYMEAEAGQHIAFGEEATIDVLWPTKAKLRGTRSDLNANSVVLRLEHGDNCFLFVGDAEEETEVRLQVRGLETCEMLKVAHHGSDHSSTDRFLSKVQPQLAFISVGEHNRYNHPGEETLRRLERHGAKVHRTDLGGSMRVISDGRQLTVLEGIATVATSRVAPPEAQAQAWEQARSQAQDHREEGAPDYEGESYGVASGRFVASKKSEVFHNPDCEWAQKISPQNLKEFDSYDAAADSGRRPARCCNPTPDQEDQ